LVSCGLLRPPAVSCGLLRLAVVAPALPTAPLHGTVPFRQCQPNTSVPSKPMASPGRHVLCRQDEGRGASVCTRIGGGRRKGSERRPRSCNRSSRRVSQAGPRHAPDPEGAATRRRVHARCGHMARRPHLHPAAGVHSAAGDGGGGCMGDEQASGRTPRRKACTCARAAARGCEQRAPPAAPRGIRPPETMPNKQEDGCQGS
jgi:hypothetical protein